MLLQKKHRLRQLLFFMTCIFASVTAGVCLGQAEVRLPAGAKAVWDIEKAHRLSTPARDKICINGLWRWQTPGQNTDTVPAGGWGYFKVPGCWPGITNYMQKDCQTVHSHPDWAGRNLRSVKGAWYQRRITVPAEWQGRRISIRADYVNSHATVYIDGRNAGAIIFPGGELDITAFCRPSATHRGEGVSPLRLEAVPASNKSKPFPSAVEGATSPRIQGRDALATTHVLSIYVAALPLKAVMLSYSDTASAKEVAGSVARRGLCGDVYLIGTPAGPRITDVKVDTSVRNRRITYDAALEDLDDDGRYALAVEITDQNRTVAEFRSKTFQASEIKNGRIAFSQGFKPEKLWDIHTPDNIYQLHISLLKANGKLLDVFHPVRFGFREFWIEGRDFYLNGTRIFLSGVPLDNAQIGAALANYDAACESLRRLKSFGINFVYTHNYGCEPGSHLSFEEVLKAADDVGMLVALSQPHFSHYEWDKPDADEKNGYARHAEFYVRVAQNHPSVVFYSMSHNATGYSEDMNPDMIDGVQNPRDTWSLRNSRRAERAAAIVEELDPSRIVYHHSSGNLGPLHTSNFYANFVPVQEMSDWFEHWATAGVKPLFTCEYSVPFPWDWTMYRGWYKGKREFGSAKVPWEFCLAEWNSQFLGDEAFRISEMEKANLRWEAKQFQAARVWHRWDYPYVVGSSAFAERHPVYAMYFTDNWRAFRTWGVSAISPWSHGHYWTLRDGVERSRRELPIDWENLQRPGFSPDYIDRQYERMDLAFERSDWMATVAARALIRNNRPLLGYIAGKPGAFTSKDHNFLPGETVEKQLIIVNNCRETVTCDCRWSLNLPQPLNGKETVTIPTGQQDRIKLRFELPAELPEGTHELNATFKFDNGETQTDSFLVHIMPRPKLPRINSKIALFDPKGETATLLNSMEIPHKVIGANADLSAYEILIVGKSAMTIDGPAPNITRVRDGLKVLVFEQTAEVLEKRFGFRTAQYGLRRAFKRLRDHPLLRGIKPEHLRDWRGDATILPARLDYELRPRYGPTVEWCGMPVTRLWRCGNRGNVASVLIEKPARGDFLPILDGGYSLQYSPLMEYREGRGMVLICQMDVTGRTEDEPAARRLAQNVLNYVSEWRLAPRRKIIYLGDPAGRQHLKSAGFDVERRAGPTLHTGQVLVVGPGGGKELAGGASAVPSWLKSGGNLLAIGLDEQQITEFLPLKVRTEQAEHISSYFKPFGYDSLLTGIGPADVHCREPRNVPLISEGVRIIGDGVLGKVENLNVVFCQLVPWQFDHQKQNTRRSFRRISFCLTRLLADMGAAGATPLLERFAKPINPSKAEKRWMNGFYLDEPEEWDAPYRFFRW